MPISVTCSCGKTLQVRDELAGKAVKCPGCQSVIKVGPAGAPAPAMPARPAANSGAARRAAPAPAGPHDPALDRLFEEEGFKMRTGQFCPACAEPLQPGAVLCTKCGFHLQAGTRLQGHQTSLEDHDGAEATLRRAASDMKRAKELDEKLQAAGMPPWMMALILFMLVSVAGVGVAAVNVANRAEGSEVSFNAVATLLVLAGVALAAVASGASCVVIYKSFKEDTNQGLMVMFIPFYVFYYAFSRFGKVGKPFLVSIVMTALAATSFVMAALSMAGKF